MHFWTKLWSVNWVKVEVEITVFRGIYTSDNFYLNYCIEVNQVNFSPFSRYKLHTHGGQHSVPANVNLDTETTPYPSMST